MMGVEQRMAMKLRMAVRLFESGIVVGWLGDLELEMEGGLAVLV